MQKTSPVSAREREIHMKTTEFKKWPLEFLAFQTEDSEGILPDNYRIDLKSTQPDPFER